MVGTLWNKRLGLAALLLLLALAGHAWADDSQDGMLQDVLDTECPQANIPGCVVLLSHPDGTSEAAAWGVSDVEQGTPMQTGDLMRAGSVTKMYIAVLALKLADDGYFSLDDHAADYVGVDNHLLKEAMDPGAVTIRQLLGHQSGVPDTLSQLRDAVPWLLDVFDGNGKIRQSLPQLAGDGEPFEPGTNCRYSNTGYVLLGEVIEKATGRSLATLLYHYIFEPLGLKHTFYAAEEHTPPQAQGYVYADGRYADVTLWDRPEIAGAAGAILTDVDDLATFGRALFGTGPDAGTSGGQVGAGGTLLRPAQFAQMTAFHPMEGSGEYGLGMFRLSIGGRAALGHPGATVGYRAELEYFPDTGIIAVAMANCGRAPLKDIVDKALDAEGK